MRLYQLPPYAGAVEERRRCSPATARKVSGAPKAMRQARSASNRSICLLYCERAVAPRAPQVLPTARKQTRRCYGPKARRPLAVLSKRWAAHLQIFSGRAAGGGKIAVREDATTAHMITKRMGRGLFPQPKAQIQINPTVAPPKLENLTQLRPRSRRGWWEDYHVQRCDCCTYYHQTYGPGVFPVARQAPTPTNPDRGFGTGKYPHGFAIVRPRT